jgi:putative ABC transport system ATP-binding protein
MLELSHIVRTFHAGTPNEMRALNEVSLRIETGSFVVVIGTNGSGKTTLLNSIAGTFTPDAGSIVLSGHNVTTWPEHRRAALIGRVFQNPLAGSAPDMTIEENLALATGRGMRRGLNWLLSRSLRQALRDRVAELKMGLENRLNNPMGTLSGGQRQALTLLMATWRRPDLLLLDEHTAALDPKSADKILELTHRIVHRDRLTTLMVTHSMRQAVDFGDRLVMMREGKILHDLRGNDKSESTPESLLRRFDEAAGQT